MDKYQETFDTWNKVASLYEEKFMDLDLYDESYDLFCEMIKQDAAILELGCGPGNITRYLLSKRPDLKIHSTDISPNMLEIARKHNPAAKFSVMDTRKIDEIKNKYDGIVCGFCIPYLSEPDTEKLIADTHNLLKPKGLFYISFIEGKPSQSRYMTGSTTDRTYFYYHEVETVKALLHANAFLLLNTFNITYKKSATETEIHTVLIAQLNA